MARSSQPVSRRDRPAKTPLSREWIVATTVEIVRREGLDRATMRRVAQELDTGPASLYVYVANTTELRAAVLDALLSELEMPVEGDWFERLTTLMHDYHEVLTVHTGLARSALIMRPSGPNWIVLFDRVLGLLLEAGVPSGQASWGADALLLYATATAAEHSEPGVDDAPERENAGAQLEQATRGADPAHAPHVSAHADEILGGRGMQRWAWVLQAMVAGFKATPVDSRQG